MPGSTRFLVWTHTRNRFDYRANPSFAGRFHNDFDTSPLFENRPENCAMSKVSFWSSL
ncbi:hypothetical protein JXA88_01275 [Candidatus Fermentibacteria bacterium]|nr:hypothetical protein [Candidatus Fermentibacteria bacterium]